MLRYLWWSTYVPLLLASEICMGLPSGFVYLSDIDATIIQDMRYFTDNNFVGRPIIGYEAPRCILTQQAALALRGIQKKLKPLGLGLKVYDCYRPEMAVAQFVRWSKEVSDQKMKVSYYPRIDKADLFRLHYVASPSFHSSGSTVDLTLVHLKQKTPPIEMKMGTHVDFMDVASHPTSNQVGVVSQHNRLFLQHQMSQARFTHSNTEWWHFTLRNEPFCGQYFNFVVR
jgi:D-alanyl-D-alanine dipeptidase